MRRAFFVIAVLCALPAAAQIQSRPSDPPIVTADNDGWYQRGEPVQFAGDVYYPAGAAVFFNGNTMVRTGHYNGVPLYADATVEPYSQILVPLSRGLMQPYERRRSGALAGTTGSRTPGFPVQVTAGIRQDDVDVSPSPEPSRPALADDTPRPVGTAGFFATSPVATLFATARRPQTNDGVWIEFGGERWVSDGMAVPLVSSEFVLVGEHAGFPVFARRGLKEEKIYLPTREGVVAPCRLKN
jgi:hypothetical protein